MSDSGKEKTSRGAEGLPNKMGTLKKRNSDRKIPPFKTLSPAGKGKSPYDQAILRSARGRIHKAGSRRG